LLSGPAGATFLPTVQAVQAWTKYINAKGGVNGHQVVLFVYDDGGDPARHRAQVQEAVERRRVVAFVQNNEVLTGRGSIDYITAKGIPVIGSETGTQYFYENPFYFPQASSGRLMFELTISSAAQQAIPAGKDKVGWLYCAEIPACSEFDQVLKEKAPQVGFKPVYRASASIAQPDYTAECISARNANVEVFVLALDPNSVTRVAASCARQGFRPTYAITGSLVTDAQKSDPNLASLIAASDVFPYFQSGTPATDEFQKVIGSYGRDTIGTAGMGAAVGWVTAKLFEKATANLAEPPTSRSILEGLWKIKDDTLGGLTARLTFTEGKPATPVLCWFNLAVKDKRWVTPDGSTLHCR
jgi:branched-chain amino acid transport system substrate-binding protein